MAKLPTVTPDELDAIEKLHRAEFPALPVDASDDEIAARNLEVRAWNDRPGREYLFWQGEIDGKPSFKTRWIVDEDLAALRSPSWKPPARNSARLTTTEPPRLKVQSSGSLPTGSGSEKPSPVAGCLPKLDSVQWEHKDDGSIEAWHAPEGSRKRASKTYLGRVGKRLLAKWQSEPSDKLPAIVADWIAEKRAAKKIE